MNTYYEQLYGYKWKGITNDTIIYAQINKNDEYIPCRKNGDMILIDNGEKIHVGTFGLFLDKTSWYCNGYYYKFYIKIDKNKKSKKKEKIQDLKTMPYKEYLQTEHWRNTRIRKLKQANYKCQLCGSKEKLNVHHNTYKNRGNEKDEDLIVLCHHCHAKFHDKLEDTENNNSILNNKTLIKNTYNKHEAKRINNCNKRTVEEIDELIQLGFLSEEERYVTIFNNGIKEKVLRGTF